MATIIAQSIAFCGTGKAQGGGGGRSGIATLVATKNISSVVSRSFVSLVFTKHEAVIDDKLLSLFFQLLPSLDDITMAISNSGTYYNVDPSTTRSIIDSAKDLISRSGVFLSPFSGAAAASGSAASGSGSKNDGGGSSVRAVNALLSDEQQQAKLLNAAAAEVAGILAVPEKDRANYLLDAVNENVLSFLMNYIPTVKLSKLEGKYDDLQYAIEGLDLEGFQFDKDAVGVAFGNDDDDDDDGEAAKSKTNIVSDNSSGSNKSDQSSSSNATAKTKTTEANNNDGSSKSSSATAAAAAAAAEQREGTSSLTTITPTLLQFNAAKIKAKFEKVACRFKRLVFPRIEGSGRVTAAAENASIRLSFKIVNVPRGLNEVVAGKAGCVAGSEAVSHVLRAHPELAREIETIFKRKQQQQQQEESSVSDGGGDADDKKKTAERHQDDDAVVGVVKADKKKDSVNTCCCWSVNPKATSSSAAFFSSWEPCLIINSEAISIETLNLHIDSDSFAWVYNLLARFFADLIKDTICDALIDLLKSSSSELLMEANSAFGSKFDALVCQWQQQQQQQRSSSTSTSHHQSNPTSSSSSVVIAGFDLAKLPTCTAEEFILLVGERAAFHHLLRRQKNIEIGDDEDDDEDSPSQVVSAYQEWKVKFEAAGETYEFETKAAATEDDSECRTCRKCCKGPVADHVMLAVPDRADETRIGPFHRDGDCVKRFVKNYPEYEVCGQVASEFDDCDDD